jgi:hypothetical protein
MHEIFVPCDQVKEPGLLFGTSKTGHFDPGNHGLKLFMKEGKFEKEGEIHGIDE